MSVKYVNTVMFISQPTVIWLPSLYLILITRRAYHILSLEQWVTYSNKLFGRVTWLLCAPLTSVGKRGWSVHTHYVTYTHTDRQTYTQTDRQCSNNSKERKKNVIRPGVECYYNSITQPHMP